LAMSFGGLWLTKEDRVPPGDIDKVLKRRTEYEKDPRCHS